MLCDMCHSREAVICYTEIVNGVRSEKHLCQSCAAKYTGSSGYNIASGSAGFLAGLLASVLSAHEDVLSDEDMQKTNLVCPTCHMTYNEFLRDGKFGCKDCYKTFGLILDPYIKKIQGNVTHTGKCPKFQSIFAEVPEYTGGHTVLPKVKPTQDKSEASPEETLRAQLKAAIEKEEFEEAARLRDEIKQLHAQTVDEKAVPNE